jgi:hypothetical protein
MTFNWKLSPSDLTFLWDECPRCFYLKVRHDYRRPPASFPSIFNRIDRLMKEFFTGALAQELADELPQGTVKYESCWVTSKTTRLPGRSSSFYVSGIFDAVIEFEDGSYGIVDFKTSQARTEHIGFYSRQLHAYAYALEHPARRALSLAPVTRLGLLCVEPVLMDRSPDRRIAYLGDVTWLEIPKDEQGFIDFLDGVIALLEADDLPMASPNCGYCRYRESARMSGY